MELALGARPQFMLVLFQLPPGGRGSFQAPVPHPLLSLALPVPPLPCPAPPWLASCFQGGDKVASVGAQAQGPEALPSLGRQSSGSTGDSAKASQTPLIYGPRT